MSFLSVAFGKTLKAIRTERGFKQDKLGIAEAATVSRWETGQFLPADDKLDEILKVLKIGPEDFLQMMAGAENESLNLRKILDELKSIPVLVAYEKAEPDTQRAVRLSLGIELIGSSHSDPQTQKKK